MQNCSKIAEIKEDAFCNDDQIYFLQIGTMTPPKLGDYAFGYFPHSGNKVKVNDAIKAYTVLKVPAGSEEAYEAASVWTLFSSIMALD